MERRVVITGMGAVTPLGLDVPSLWDGLRTARNGIGPITLCDVSNLETRFGGEVRGFDAQNYMDRKDVRRYDRFIHFTMAAAAELFASSGFTVTPENAESVGVVIGSGIGGIETIADAVLTIRDKGPGRVGPFVIPAMITNMAAGMVSIRYGIKGPGYCTTSACATSGHAIGEAAEMIRRGWVDAAVAGGTEAPITPVAIAAFNSSRALSTRNDSAETASRPFDATRDGFVMAEGAGLLLLEEAEHARARGARILGELAGYGTTLDAHHITTPPDGGEGAFRAMRMALRHAGLRPDDVDYINAHATSTPAGDIAETQAIKTLLGERAPQVPISATKSQLGHLIGAAGVVGVITSLLAIEHRTALPTINLATPDPACDLDYVPNAARAVAKLDVALCNTFGFGGHNVTLVVKRYV